MKVLIVDDDNTSRKLLRAVLETEGHAVIAAADGQEALDSLEHHPVEAIISDLLMPNLDGYCLCRAIRQDDRWSDLPFICYTAIYSSLDDEKLAINLGADAYLRKPSTSAQILDTLRASTNELRAAVNRSKASPAQTDILNQNSRPLIARLVKKNLELNEKNRLADLAVEVGVALTRKNTLGQLLQTCSESMVKNLDASLASMWVFNKEKAVLELQATAAFDQLPGGFELGQAIVGWIAQERRPYRASAVVGELSKQEQDWARRAGVTACAGYPLIVEDRLVGVLTIFTRKELPEATLVTLGVIADSLALGIHGKDAEKALRESELRFRQLAKNINEVFWLIDRSTREVLYVSPAYETIWGRTCQSLMDQPESFFDSIHPEDRGQVVDSFEMEAEARYELEYRIVRPDGVTRWISDRTFPICDELGQLIRTAGVAEDVTEKRHFEMQQKQTQKMQPMERLAGAVVHDMTNLISSLKGSSHHPLPKEVPGNETILLVEDEDSVREVTALLLESLGYQVLQVSCAEEALNLVQGERKKIDLLFTDMIMPGMGGWELAEAFRLHDPAAKVLFQSGHTDDVMVHQDSSRSKVAFLQKPFSIGALGKKIRDLFDQR
jgi:PAS domain S-box-containing protein